MDGDETDWGAALAFWLGFAAGRERHPRVAPARFAADPAMAEIWLASWDLGHV